MGAPRFVMDDFWPSDLFLGGIPGAWYDPTDLSTMFQDSAGTTPVTAVEQPVGLILDKSQGLTLGAELVTNGDFSGGATGWTTIGNVAIAAGVATFTSGVTSTLYQTTWTMTTGRWYRATFTVTSVVTAGTISVYFGSTNSIGVNVTTPKTITVYGVSGGDNTFYIQTGAIGAQISIDDVSVVAITGNHASQSTAASRPTYRARYNLLTYSEQFDNGAWSKAGATVSANSTVAPDGTMTADTLTESAATSDHFTWQNLPLMTTAARYTASVYAKYSGRFIILILSNAVSGDAYAYFDLQNGVISQAAATTGAMWSSATATIENVGSGWYRCTLTATKDATGNAQPQVRTSDVGTGGSSRSYAGNGTSGAYIWGAQLLTAADVTATGNAYQRIAAATVYDTAPVFRPYLAFDGMDDSLSTAAINFTSTDKMTVFAGATKSSDAAVGLLAELSASANANSGSFYMAAPLSTGASGNYGWKSRGTVNSSGVGGPAVLAPNTSVLTGIGEIATDTALLRRNGAQYASDTSDQGAGNYGTFPLYIASRASSSLYFNGRLYSLIVRGAASSTTEIIDTETWVNARTGGY